MVIESQWDRPYTDEKPLVMSFAAADADVMMGVVRGRCSSRRGSKWSASRCVNRTKSMGGKCAMDKAASTRRVATPAKRNRTRSPLRMKFGSVINVNPPTLVNSTVPDPMYCMLAFDVAEAVVVAAVMVLVVVVVLVVAVVLGVVVVVVVAGGNRI